ncbi:Uu.00g106240.m01.CDS01 [Anthostomella pinea]|uniref:Uu.00g106240.m01.CDS01 n=1 Tax=Anthostomella pinea TaxID=933095 RepID=A0AAI8V8Z7_9PEZI|nr:Uu.00g106240.m01.CDS01 [Anthostomella pinea]
MTHDARAQQRVFRQIRESLQLYLGPLLDFPHALRALYCHVNALRMLDCRRASFLASHVVFTNRANDRTADGRRCSPPRATNGLEDRLRKPFVIMHALSFAKLYTYHQLRRRPPDVIQDYDT